MLYDRDVLLFLLVLPVIPMLAQKANRTPFEAGTDALLIILPDGRIDIFIRTFWVLYLFSVPQTWPCHRKWLNFKPLDFHLPNGSRSSVTAHTLTHLHPVWLHTQQVSSLPLNMCSGNFYSRCRPVMFHRLDFQFRPVWFRCQWNNEVQYGIGKWKWRKSLK